MFVSHDTPSIFLLLILLFLNVLLLHAELSYSYLLALLHHAVRAQLEEAGGGGGEGDGLKDGVVLDVRELVRLQRLYDVALGITCRDGVGMDEAAVSVALVREIEQL